MKRSLSLVLLLLITPLLGQAQSTFLPLAHPAYDFLERCDAFGCFDAALLGSKPLTRARIAQLLNEVDSQLAKLPNQLSAQDRRTLAALRWEFARDSERSGILASAALHPEGRSRWGKLSDGMSQRGWLTGAFYRNGLNFYSLESDALDAYGDFRGAAQMIRQQGESRSILITAVGVRLRASVSGKVGIHFDFLDTTERGRSPYWSRTQLYQDRVGYIGNLSGDASANYDCAEFDLALGGKLSPSGASHWELHAAKLPLRWGMGRSGQLLLADWGPSFHQIQAALTLGKRLRLVYVFGALKSYPKLGDTLYVSAGYTRTIERAKYLAAHRLEWDPHPHWRFAFAEAVVFGERSPELAYLIPINYFHAAQHDLGDEDNALLSLAAEYRPYRGAKLYAELLIDDVSFGKLGTDYFGNKLGWQGGLLWVQPAGLPNIDATLEITQLRPFIYTHQYPINVYTHWTSPLGNRFAPNSQTLFAQLRYRPHRRAQLSVNWIGYLHGANPLGGNAGGDVNLPHALDDSEDAPFLGGILEKTSRWEFGGELEVLENLFLWGWASWQRSVGEESWEGMVGFRLN